MFYIILLETHLKAENTTMILVQRVENVMRVLASVGWNRKQDVMISIQLNFQEIIIYTKKLHKLNFISRICRKATICVDGSMVIKWQNTEIKINKY